MTTDPTSPDQLDRLLSGAGPATRFDLSARERRALVRATRRRAHGRVARTAAGVALTAVLVGGGAAAFANDDLRAWFSAGIRDPYITYEYTVPSGAICTETSGDPIATDPAAAEALRTWLASADLLALIDVDAALAQLRSSPEHTGTGSDGEYQMAVGIAVVQAARAELAAQGFAPGAIDEWTSEGACAAP